MCIVHLVRTCIVIVGKIVDHQNCCEVNAQLTLNSRQQRDHQHNPSKRQSNAVYVLLFKVIFLWYTITIIRSISLGFSLPRAKKWN